MIGTMPLRDSRQEGGRMARKKKRGTFAETLVRLRTARGLSVYALAKMTGLTDQALAYLEQGGRVPSWDTVQRLARVLGVSCEVFEDEGIVLPVYRPGKPGA